MPNDSTILFLLIFILTAPIFWTLFFGSYLNKNKVKLSTTLINMAKKQAKIDFRDTSKQIEYWAMIGKVAEENTDLSLPSLKKIVTNVENSNNKTPNQV